jgi:hypothetical protein
MRAIATTLWCLVVFDAKSFPHNQQLPSQTMIRSELDRFAGILPTPRRGDGNFRRRKFRLSANQLSPLTL